MSPSLPSCLLPQSCFSSSSSSSTSTALTSNTCLCCPKAHHEDNYNPEGIQGLHVSVLISRIHGPGQGSSAPRSFGSLAPGLLLVPGLLGQLAQAPPPEVAWPTPACKSTKTAHTGHEQSTAIGTAYLGSFFFNSLLFGHPYLLLVCCGTYSLTRRRSRYFSGVIHCIAKPSRPVVAPLHPRFDVVAVGPRTHPLTPLRPAL